MDLSPVTLPLVENTVTKIELDKENPIGDQSFSRTLVPYSIMIIIIIQARNALVNAALNLRVP
jgi:hypothetical protein